MTNPFLEAINKPQIPNTSNPSANPFMVALKSLTPSQPIQKPTQPEQPKSLLGKVGSYISDVWKTGVETIKNPLGIITKEKTNIQAIAQNLIDKAGYLGSVFETNKSIPEKVAAGAEWLQVLANFTIQPITVPFDVLSQVPGGKLITDTMGVVLGAGGKVTKFTADKALNILPISSESKAVLRQPIGELADFAGQMTIGAYLLGKAGEVLKTGKEFTVEKAKELVRGIPQDIHNPTVAPIVEIAPKTTNPFMEAVGVKEVPKAPKIAPTTPKIAPEVIGQRELELKTPYRSNLPVIEPIIIRPESKIAELQTHIGILEDYLNQAPERKLAKYANKNGEIPEALGVGKSIFGKMGDEIAQELGFADSESARTAYEQYRNSRQKLNDLKTELSNTKADTFSDYTPEQLDRINNLAMQATKSVENISKFESKKFSEESQKVTDLINSGINNARAVVRGEESTNIRAGAIIAGMEEYAKQHPKEAADIIQELANSPLKDIISIGASETSFARMTEDTVTSKLSEVKRSYEGKVFNLSKKKAEMNKSLKAEKEKFNLSKEERSFNNFLDNIVCK